jgi:hypothetical protein
MGASRVYRLVGCRSRQAVDRYSHLRSDRGVGCAGPFSKGPNPPGSPRLFCHGRQGRWAKRTTCGLGEAVGRRPIKSCVGYGALSRSAAASLTSYYVTATIAHRERHGSAGKACLSAPPQPSRSLPLTLLRPHRLPRMCRSLPLNPLRPHRFPRM